MFRFTFFKCKVCPQVFRYPGDRDQHCSRSHCYQERRCIRLKDSEGFMLCRVCGVEQGGEFMDGRALKRHYRDRSIHSVASLLHAGLDLWMLDGVSIDEMDECRSSLQDRNLIVEKASAAADSDRDEDYVPS